MATGKALAIANNDIVYLWWTMPKKIPDCLGFTIHRLQAGKAAVPLPAFVGFDPKQVTPVDPKNRNTDFLPIQSFQWKDLFVPEETNVSYEIIPVAGKPGEKLTQLIASKFVTNKIRATDQLGKHRVIFNRGIISTQALSRKLKMEEGELTANALRKVISEPGNDIRNGLAGESLAALPSLLRRAKAEGGKCFAALYELTDPELIAALIEHKDFVELILSNADGSKIVNGKQVKDYDATNKESRLQMKAALGAKFHDRLLPKGNFIGHNKFVVYVNKSGKAKAVLTGSTNWTANGMCAQSNNILILENDKIAETYRDYWNRLLLDNAVQGTQFRSDNANAPAPVKLPSKGGEVQIRFSPNTPQKNKPTNPATPSDMQEVFDIIGKAKRGVLFLVFNPGSPSILERIKEVAEDRDSKKIPFFVRGAISDDAVSSQFATRVFRDSALATPDRLITGIGGVKDAFAFWEKELAKLGHAVIHDKIVVVDPFDEGRTVITGSHNLGFKASYSNDENFCIIRGNRAIAEAYTAHILDVVNHYSWRFRLLKSGKSAFAELAQKDDWQDKYFKNSFLATRDQFFFPKK